MTQSLSMWTRLREEAQKRLEGAEPAHDFSHVERVVHNAQMIAKAEGANVVVCETAALLHELFNYPKNHPESRLSGDVCAAHARTLLEGENAPRNVIDGACEAIADHAFSKGATPRTLETMVLQDADRLDAIGAIGIARCMATCASMKRPLYNPVDPFCVTRTPDDKLWGLDHMYKKLLRIPERLHTATAKKLAEERITFLHAFAAQLKTEIEDR